MSTPLFRWATVTTIGPLRIKLDGDSAALPITPDSLIDPALLLPGDRVRVELTYQRVIIHGRSAGSSQAMSGTLVAPSASGAFWDVLLDAGQAASGTVVAIPWEQSTNYRAGVGVEVVRSGYGGVASWKIVSVRSPFLPQIPITLINNWVLYADSSGDQNDTYGSRRYGLGTALTHGSAWAGNPYVTVSRYGIVHVEGLLYRSASPTAGDIICQLPPNARPTRQQRISTLCSAGVGELLITPDGNVRWLSGATGFYSLNNIRFRASWAAVAGGVAPFVDLIQYCTNMKSYVGSHYTGGPTDNAAGYTVDPDGVLLFEGCLQPTVAYAANAVFGALPSTSIGDYTAASHQMINIPNVAFTMFRYGTNAGTAGYSTPRQMNVSVAVGTSNFIPLSNQSLVNPNSTTTTTLVSSPPSSFTTYGAGWRVPSVAITPENLVFPFGLFSGGAINAAMQVYSIGRRPRYTALVLTVGNSAAIRLDIGGQTAVGVPGSAGLVTMSSPAQAWTTLDGLSWPAAA